MNDDVLAIYDVLRQQRARRMETKCCWDIWNPSVVGTCYLFLRNDALFTQHL